MSVDSLTSTYPELTPYQFASNTPIMSIDLDGLESKVTIIYQHQIEPVLINKKKGTLSSNVKIDNSFVIKEGEWFQNGNKYVNFEDIVNVDKPGYKSSGTLAITNTLHKDGSATTVARFIPKSEWFENWKASDKGYHQNAGIVFTSYSPAGSESAETKTAEDIIDYINIDPMLGAVQGDGGSAFIGGKSMFWLKTVKALDIFSDFAGLYVTSSNNGKNKQERISKEVLPVPTLDTFITCDFPSCKGKEFPISDTSHSDVQDTIIKQKTNE